MKTPAPSGSLTGAGEPTSLHQALRSLTEPGARLEIGRDDRGRRNFVKRAPSVIELVASAARAGDRDFLVQGDQRMSFAEFADTVWGTAQRLIDEGLRAGDRLAIMAPNSIEWVVTVFAAAAAGAVPAACNTSWTQDELSYAIGDCGARFLVVDGEWAAEATALLAGESTVERIYVSGSERQPPRQAQSLRTIIERAESRPDVAIAESDPFVIIYTSGTTGRSKGCVTTHEGTVAQVNSMVLSSVLAKATSSRTDKPAVGDHALLATSPLFHVSGLHSGICSSLATRSKVVFLRGKFDPLEVLALIEAEKITAWGGVPTMIHRVLTCDRFDDFDISSLRSLSIGGAPLRPATLELAQRVFGEKLNMGHGYGMTETHGSITMNAGRALAERPGSVGLPGPLVDLQVVDDSNSVVAEGVSGEILVRGVTVTPGYWGDQVATAAAIRDGWLHTGDVGAIDERGYLYLQDRAKDLIIRGGENIGSVEIEHCLSDHPAVAEAAVFGVPDDDLGERIGAVVVLVPDAEITTADLIAFVASTLGRIKAPEWMRIVDDPLPRNILGKVLKPQLRQMVAAMQ